MKKTAKTLKSLLALFLPVAMLAACTDEHPVNVLSVTVTVERPELYADVSIDSVSVTAENIYTGDRLTRLTSADGQITALLEEGEYTFTASAVKRRSAPVGGSLGLLEVTLVGSRENVSVNSRAAAFTVSLQASLIPPDGGWVIKEIYYRGGKTKEGSKSYWRHHFFEIYNNSNVTLYADGLALSETQLNGASSTNGIFSEAELRDTTFVRALYAIPGNGSTYPVQPGGSLLIASQPIDHRSIATPELDLSGADFQWYDYTPLAGQAIDVAEVPNLIKYYSYSNTIWVPTVQGNTAWLLSKIPDLNNDYVFSHTDIRPMAHIPTNYVTSVKIANEHILDAVECKSVSNFNGKMLSPTLDAGAIVSGATYSGKSVRRRVKEVTANGRIIYKDTNNSDEDFIAEAEPKPRSF
ncbi:MAG: DUF4876 domain-containing protein [Prevotellaceae bacterium]|jgi:hypothetical protein|nr:DUF4876 domain-containing protein [Prevotellaceae bacterium]